MNLRLRSSKSRQQATGNGQQETGRIVLSSLLIIVGVMTGAVVMQFPFLSRAEFTVLAEPPVLPANGVSVSTLRAQTRTVFFKKPVQWKIVRGASRVDILEKTSLSFTVQSTLKTGDVVVEALNGALKKRVVLHLIPDTSDSDADGLPDVAELASLEDKTAFLKRFVAVARAQYVNPSPRWHDGNRNCAGLVRFAFQEALKKNNESILTGETAHESFSMPDVKKFNYPDIPVLGKNIFRTKKGNFTEEDTKKNVFSSYVDSRGLMEFNTRFVSKDVEKAQEGDLLFFLHFDDLSMPYHAMIYAGGDESGKAWLVYHTGPVHKTKGKVKMVTMDALLNFDDERWHPESANPYFLGVYRLKIVD